MAAKGGRRARPRKASMRGCINYKGNKPKMCFDSLDEGDEFLKKTNQFNVKIAYRCDVCGSVHVGRRIHGKSNDRSRQALQDA